MIRVTISLLAFVCLAPIWFWACRTVAVDWILPVWPSSSSMWVLVAAAVVFLVSMVGMWLRLYRRFYLPDFAERFVLLELPGFGMMLLLSSSLLTSWCETPSFEPTHQSTKIVVMVPITPEVLFRDDDLRQVELEKNALAEAVLQVCEGIDRRTGAGPATDEARVDLVQRLGFLDWLAANWEYLTNWRPVDNSRPRAADYSAPELVFYEGSGMRNGDASVGLCSAVAKRWRTLREEPHRVPVVGLPAGAAGVQRARDAQTLVIVFATGDFDSLEQAKGWTKSGERLVSLLLPCVPRSKEKWDELRNSKGRFKWIDGQSTTTVWLTERIGRMPLMSVAQDIDGQDANVPRDLDEVRRRHLGEREVGNVRNAAQQGAVDAILDKIGLDHTPVGALRELAMLPIVLAWLVWWGVALVTLPAASFSLDERFQLPGRMVRGAIVFLSVALVGVVALFVWQCWPTSRDHLLRRPALCVWIATTSWSVLVLWPIVRKVFRVQPHVGPPRMRDLLFPRRYVETTTATTTIGQEIPAIVRIPVAILLAVQIAIVPALGMTPLPEQVRPAVDWAFLGVPCLATIALSVLCVQPWRTVESEPRPKEDKRRFPDRSLEWLHPMTYAIAAAFQSLTLAALVVGFAPAPTASAGPFLAAAFLLATAALLTTWTMRKLRELWRRRCRR